MPSSFFNDLNYLPRRKFSAKYTMPALLALLVLVLLGQLILQFTPIYSMHKVSGAVDNISERITSYTHSRGSFKRIPIYSLVITLSNGHCYYIQNTTYKLRAAQLVHIGDTVTLYVPTTLIKVIGTGFAPDVSQLERNRKVIISWKEQQRYSWFDIGVLVVMIIFFGIMRQLYLKEQVQI